MEYEHVDFPAAVRKLAARAGITIVEERGATDEDRQYETRRKLLKLHAEAAGWFHENLIKKDIGEPARKYLKQRGITGEIAKRWQLGYAPDEWDAFGSWARGQAYDARDLHCEWPCQNEGRRSNIEPQSSNFVRSFSRPDHVSDLQREGEVIAFSGRLLKEEEGAPKYLELPRDAALSKRRMCFLDFTNPSEH